MFRMLLIALFACFATISAASAGDWREEGPRTLVMTYRAPPAARLSFRDDVRAETLPRLAALKAAGDLDSYHVLVSRYADAQSWDMMAILTFHSPAALARWRAVEAAAPAGLGPKALKLVGQVESAPGDVMREKVSPQPTAEAPVYLVVPYDYLVSTDSYLAYVDGYLLPQVDGWVEEGAISSYGIFLPRYAAGRSWSSLLILAYRGDAGLARRDSVVKSVRARLAEVPEWKAFADNKAKIRDEKVPMIADELF